MTHHPDNDQLAQLEADHLRFGDAIRELLQQPAGAPAWPVRVQALSQEIERHLQIEERGLLSALATDGTAGTANALRTGLVRVRRALSNLGEAASQNRFDEMAVLTLADEVAQHAARTDGVLREWQASGALPHDHPIAAETASVVSGMLVGATMGAMAGPIGAAGGAIAGGLIAGAAAAAASMGNTDEQRHDEELDAEIGVSGGNLGEAKPNRPPARVGAFSSAAVGGGGRGGGEDDDAAGPIPEPVQRN